VLKNYLKIKFYLNFKIKLFVTMTKYLIALGSNLETEKLQKLEIIKKALIAFSNFNMKLIKVSSFWESRSYPDESQPNFINAVSEVYSELNPYEILNELKKIEKMFGRKTSKIWGNRVLDLDILSSGSIILPNLDIFNMWLKMPFSLQISNQSKVLILPHPRIQDRLFVLQPLSEVNPDWIHPVLKKNAQELINIKNWDKKKFLKIVKN
tara:strand:+ start:471 stop:1097 length:627 start_codon:yes stop_codon:yes gene_type:complete